MTPTDRLLCRLGQFCALDDRERGMLVGALGKQLDFSAGEDLVRERQPTAGVLVIHQGFACRYKLLPDGRRQIVGLLLPGDMCDMRAILLTRMDHSIGALGPVSAALIPSATAVALIASYPQLTRAFWARTVVDDAITREWIVNVGHRTAYERVAHLLCEIYWRLQAVELAHGDCCDMPLTQQELADTLALSSVHVNRTLMGLRREGLLQLHAGRLQLLDSKALQMAAGFDPYYLHLDASGARPARPGLRSVAAPGFG